MPRFVVLQHDTPAGYRQGLHWDLMLEAGEDLLTWALDQPPALNSVIPATELPPHRMHYLDYEGPVGGDRGDVARWDAGELEWIRRDEQECVAVLRGRVTWQVTLHREDGRAWIATFSEPET